jgi:protein-disulfide isomerase
MDVDALARCEADPATRAAIEREVEQGRAYGVEATPTLFVNGRLLGGMRTLENLVSLVDEEKQKGGPKAASH